jgi:hypothetical protein
MQRQIAAFVEEPCRKTFLAARDAVLKDSPLRLVSTELAELDGLIELGQHQQVLDRLDALPASRILSPRVHCLAAEAAEALGQIDEGELERSLFVLVLKGLLSTGDGTPGNPYIVCHPSDEYDIVAALSQEAAGQSLVEQNGRLFDVLLCADGREMWFDVTDCLARRVRRPLSRRKQLARRLPGRQKRRPSRLPG